MLSGVVNVVTNPAMFAAPPAALPAAVAGDVQLLESAADPFQTNQVSMRSTGNPNEYEVAGLDGTQVQVNNGPIDASQIVNFTGGNIYVMLGAGSDTFQLLPMNASTDSNVPAHLFVVNTQGDTIELGDFTNNDPSGVTVNGEIAIVSAGGPGGISTLNMEDTTVVGPVVVRNGAGGSATKIVDSELLGVPTPLGVAVPVLPVAGGAILPGPGGFAFSMRNSAGTDVVEMLGSTTFGAGFSPTTLDPAVTIADNFGGGTMVRFGPEAAGDTGRVEVFGGLGIANGTNVQNVFDFVNLNQTDVTGAVVISNDGGAGGSRVMLNDSNLGTNLLPPAPGTGRPVVIGNGVGQEAFSADSLEAPWGLFMTNVVGVGPLGDVAGSSTQITDSFLGTRPHCTNLAGVPFIPAPVAASLLAAGYVPGDAFLVQGGNGRDVLNVANTQMGGTARVELGNGINDFNLTGNSTGPAVVIPSLFYNATLNTTAAPNANGFGVDHVELRDISIAVGTTIFLGTGNDSLEIRGSTVLPDPVTGLLVLNGGFGMDSLGMDPATPIILPPLFETPIP